MLRWFRISVPANNGSVRTTTNQHVTRPKTEHSTWSSVIYEGVFLQTTYFPGPPPAAARMAAPTMAGAAAKVVDDSAVSPDAAVGVAAASGAAGAVAKVVEDATAAPQDICSTAAKLRFTLWLLAGWSGAWVLSAAAGRERPCEEAEDMPLLQWTNIDKCANTRHHVRHSMLETFSKAGQQTWSKTRVQVTRLP